MPEARIFELVNYVGKTISQSSTLTHAIRESEWRDLNADRTDFAIVVREAKRWGGLSFAAPLRYPSPWPANKISDFSRQYLGGERVTEIAAYFDTSVPQVCKRARGMGLPQRREWETTQDKYGGVWSEEHDELINFMYDEGMSEDEIAQHLSRSKAGVVARLRETAEHYSEQSSIGRYLDSARAKKVRRTVETS